MLVKTTLPNPELNLGIAKFNYGFLIILSATYFQSIKLLCLNLLQSIVIYYSALHSKAQHSKIMAHIDFMNIANYFSSHQESKRHYHTGSDETDNLGDHSRLGLTYEMNDIFRSESERLKTFENWAVPWLDKNVLAQTGVFFTGDGDKVKCYFCGVEIGRWEPCDHPVQEHLRWSPHCPLLRRRTTNNEPLDIESLNEVLPAVSYDVCGANDVLPLSSDSTGQSLVHGCSSAASSSMPYYPEYPEYAIESARLRSFAEWPRNMKQKPEQLAEAGFFYTGTGDRVKCYNCGGGLKDWDDDDLPWEQHALWLKDCRFLKLMKGEQYIEDVIAQHKAKEAKQQQPCEDNNLSASAVAAVVVETTGEAAAVSAEAKSESNNTEAVAEQLTAKPATNAANSDILPANLSYTTATTTTSNASNIPEEKLCKICYGAEFNTAFLPCGHVVACAKCASSVTKCPMCRKPFSDIMRVYFS